MRSALRRLPGNLELFALFAHALSSAASLATIGASLLGGATVISGKVPRAGPLRALVLGVSSRYGPLIKSAPSSQRDAEVAFLRATLLACGDAQFVVVNGPKGVGEHGLRALRRARAPACGMGCDVVAGWPLRW